MLEWTAQGILTRFEEDIIDAHAELKELRAKVGSLRERNSTLEAQQQAEAVQVSASRANSPSSSRVSRTRVSGAEHPGLVWRSFE